MHTKIQKIMSRRIENEYLDQNQIGFVAQFLSVCIRTAHVLGVTFEWRKHQRRDDRIERRRLAKNGTFLDFSEKDATHTR